MTGRARPMQWVLSGVVIILGSFLIGLVGLALGAEFGDSFCSVCEFNGLTGYEATGQVGFLIGAGVGFVVTAWGSWTMLTPVRPPNRTPRTKI